MTTYRLFPATNGPATVAGTANPFISGMVFAVSGGGAWFQGYWWWVTPAGMASTVKCALWSATSSGTGVVVPGSVVTSGTLVPGQWNYIPLPAPIQLAPSYAPNGSTLGSMYVAAIGANGGFPATASSWNNGDAYAAGITSGPLVAYSGTTGSKPPPYSMAQGVFSTAGSDPSTSMPHQVDSSGDGATNFWVDVQLSDTAPAGYGGSYRLWPSKSDASNQTAADAAVNYVIATEVHLTAPCQLGKVWYYSSSGVTQLATRAGVYSIQGANAGTEVAAIASPSWSGAAGSGWVGASFAANTVLQPGSYKVYAYNNASPVSAWSAKDAGSDYFRNGPGGSGIRWGPLYAPQLSQASLAYNFNGNAGGTPPFSDGTQLAGQPTFAEPGTGGPAYPYLYAPVGTPTAGSTQVYWVDLEVTPTPSGSGGVTLPKPSLSAAGTAAPPPPPARIWRPCYCNRTEAAMAIDFHPGVDVGAALDRAILSATENIEGQFHRVFYPSYDTRWFDWPNQGGSGGGQYAEPWRLWLNDNDIACMASLVTGGITIPLSAVFLEPVNNPRKGLGFFTYLELDRGQPYFFGGNSATPQHNIAVTGTWGYGADADLAGSLASAVAAVDTSVTLTSGAIAGPGDLLVLGYGRGAAPFPSAAGTAGAIQPFQGERVVVTDVSAVATGLTQSGTGAGTISDADQALTVTGSGSLMPGEVIALDQEAMLVEQVSGSVATVQRAYWGTALQDHSAASVMAYRSYRVLRAQLGTTAGSYPSGAAVCRHRVPQLVRDLAIAEASTQLLQEGSGYARTVGSGESAVPAPGMALADRWAEARARHGRKARIRGI